MQQFCKLFSISKTFIPLFLTYSALTTTPLQSESRSTAFSKPFIEAAKTSTPAVVAIKVEFTSKSSRSERFSESPEYAPDDFFERFFGMPFGRERKQRGPQIGFGSGFLISEDGYIVTNNHILENASSITVTTNDGRELKASLVGTDPNTDVGLIKIDAEALPFLQFADSSQTEVGEWVLAIGNPLGLRASVTTGIISAKGRNELDITPVEEFLQTDAAINSGNSGGPLVNLDGQVVGMNTAMLTSSGGYMGICFAIPSNMVKSIVGQLKTSGKVSRGYIGIAPQPITSDMAKALRLDKAKGALVSEVMPESPAAKAGIQSGDVVLEINGASVENAAALRSTISQLLPGTKITIKLCRGDKILSLPVLVAEFPKDELAMEHVGDRLGIEIETLTQDLAKQVGCDVTKGILITAVDPQSIAYEVGLRRGYVITSVNKKDISTSDEFYAAIKETAPGQPILFQIKIGLRTRYVTITLK